MHAREPGIRPAITTNLAVRTNSARQHKTLMAKVYGGAVYAKWVGGRGLGECSLAVNVIIYDLL